MVCRSLSLRRLCYDWCMSQITVFGASGRVGSLVIEQALAKGYSVVAFVHHKPKFADQPNLKVVQGDIHTPADVSSAVKGSSAVISALGSWGTKSKDIVCSGTQNIIPAMKNEGVQRIITLTGSDARAAGDKLGWLHRLTHSLINISPARKILIDGEKHVKLLEASDLDWTTVRSPVMNQRGKALDYRLEDKRSLPWATINRRSVADSLVDLIENKQYSRKAPFIVRR